MRRRRWRTLNQSKLCLPKSIHTDWFIGSRTVIINKIWFNYWLALYELPQTIAQLKLKITTKTSNIPSSFTITVITSGLLLKPFEMKKFNSSPSILIIGLGRWLLLVRWQNVTHGHEKNGRNIIDFVRFEFTLCQSSKKYFNCQQPIHLRTLHLLILNSVYCIVAKTVVTRQDRSCIKPRLNLPPTPNG